MIWWYITAETELFYAMGLFTDIKPSMQLYIPSIQQFLFCVSIQIKIIGLLLLIPGKEGNLQGSITQLF